MRTMRLGGGLRGTTRVGGVSGPAAVVRQEAEEDSSKKTNGKLG